VAPNPILPAGGAGGAGPLGDYIAGFESGSASYNAFNRGSSPPKNTGTVGGEKIDLVNMTIDEILSQRASSQPDPTKRLFAVGRYQCIPDTLIGACKKLGIPTSSKFDAATQDRIFVEFLSVYGSMGAYLKGSSADDEAALINACSACAGVWASIEDPKLGRGRYDGVGTNNAHGKTAGTKAAFKAQYAFIRKGAVQAGGSNLTDGSGNAVLTGDASTDRGIKAAAGQSVSKQAPAEFMKKADAPTPDFELVGRGNPDDGNYQPGLTTPQVKALMVEIAYAESDFTQEFKTTSTLGRYGINAVLLAEYGYIKPDYLKKYKLDTINQANAWTGKEGIKSSADFLKSVGAQDSCMAEFIQDSYKRLINSRGIDFKDSICAAAGMIYVAYFFKEETQLFGSDVNAMVLAAKTWREDNTGTNAAKQTPIDSYNRGRYAIDVLSVAGSAAGGGSGDQSATADSDTGINPDDIFNYSSPTGRRADFDKLSTSFKNAILRAGQEYKQKTGKKINLASAYRAPEEQERIYATWVAAGGGPGVPTAGGVTTPALPLSKGGKVNSHGSGVAVDMGAQAAEMASVVDLAKYGLKWGGTFSTPDKVHIQLASFVPGAQA
jgi:hypothetical protein